MIIDQQATKQARKAHEKGIERLNELFAFVPSEIPFVPQTGRAGGVTAEERLVWRRWRRSNPEYVKRRRARKRRHESRRRNR